MSSDKKNKIPVISFFTGGGFMDMGFIEAGFNIVWTNEVDPVFSKLYAEGITSWKNSKGIKGKFSISNTNSIKDINKKEILSQAFGNSQPEIFGVIGGPPCQDFTINGNLNGFKGDRGSLTDTFLDRILDLDPAFFVMENVTGLIKVKKNAKHFTELLDVMREEYIIDYGVLNSLNFGVPQNRERIFVIGINRSVYNTDNIEINLDGSWFPFPVNKKYNGAVNKYEWPEAITFGLNVTKPQGVPIELCVSSCLVSEKDANRIPNANEFFNLYVDKRKLRTIKEGETNRPSFKRLHRYKYSPTTCYGNNEVHLHPYQHRRLSAREALRIQGVSDFYILQTKELLSKKFKMIGNGVPVPLSRVVALKLLKFLKKLEQK